jgi:hypothetical protein
MQPHTGASLRLYVVRSFLFCSLCFRHCLLHYFIFAECDAKPGTELVLLNDKWLETYHLSNLKLKPIARYRIPHNDIIPLHLHAGDFNHNGRDELYLTLGRPVLVEDKNDTILTSMIVEFTGKTPKLLGKEYPYYFRVIEQRDGKKVLMAQEMAEYDQYKVPIRWGGFYNGKFVVKKEYNQSRDVFSLYNFNFSPFNKNHILVIDEAGNVAGFNAKNSEHLITADSQYGAECSTAPNTSTSWSTGTVLETTTTDKRWLVITDSTGKAVIDISDTGTPTYYLNVEIDGKIYASSAITFS